MAYESYKVTKGEVKRNATVTAPTGAETITATVGVGGIALIIEDTAALNQNDVINFFNDGAPKQKIKNEVRNN